MKLISRIALIMTSVAGIVFVILGICFTGMYGYMTSVVAKNNATTTDVIIVSENTITPSTELIVLETETNTGTETATTTTDSGAIITKEEKEELPNFTSKGATGMLIVGIVLFVYGAACAIISIMALKKLEEAKTAKDIRVLAILASIFSFIAPGIFLLRLSDDDIREKKEYEDLKR